jgi:D-alanine transaminase
MSRIAYVNGRYVPHSEAAVHVEDRGYQFADGIYEVVAIKDGVPVDFALHYNRFCDGMAALEIAPPMGKGALVLVLKQIIRRNRLRQGMVYFQVTRGVAPRNHPFPENTPSSFVVTARPNHGASSEVLANGVKLISCPDLRWARRDIKSIALLPNVLAKQKAYAAGAKEAILVTEEGMVTEGSSSTMWMVDGEGQIVTHPLGPSILPGTVRNRMILLAKDAGYTVVERPFSLQEAKEAREVFYSSSTSFAISAVQIDEQVIGNGAPGLVAGALRQAYVDFTATIDPATAWN